MKSEMVNMAIGKKNKIQDFFINYTHVMIIALAFLIPLSTSLTSIALILFLIGWIAIGDLKKRIMQIVEYPIAKVTLLFLMLYFIGALYASYSNEVIPWEDRFLVLSKQCKFIMLLLWLPILRDVKTRQTAFWAFMLAVLVTLICGYIRYFTNLTISSRFIKPYLFKDSIHTSFILCVAVFLSAQYIVYFYKKKNNIPLITMLTLIIMGATFYLFYMGFGRAGYILFFVLVMLFLKQMKQAFDLKPKMIRISLSVVLGTVWFMSAYSPIFQSRIQAIQSELTQYIHGDPKTSIGTRIEYFKNSLLLAKEHPIAGYGTGSVKSVYKNFALQRQDQEGDNPHNEYLNILLQLGFIGWLFLAYWVFTIVKASQSLPVFEKNVLHGVLLAMGIGCLANSWITDFTSGYLFVYWVAFSFSAQSSKEKSEEGIPIKMGYENQFLKFKY